MKLNLIAKHENDPRACRDGLVEELKKLMAADDSVVYVDCDLMSCLGTKSLRQLWPDRAIEAGIAEANAAGIAAGIILLVGLPLLLKDDTAKEKTPVIARQSVSRTSLQPVPQPVAEEKTENAMAEVQLAPQPARQPARKRRKAAQGSDDDIQSAPVEEPVMAEESDIQPCFDIDPKMQLYAAEIEMEKSAHQRQAAYEKEMKQRGLELLLYIFADKEENIAHGVVNTQKS